MSAAPRPLAAVDPDGAAVEIDVSHFQAGNLVGAKAVVVGDQNHHVIAQAIFARQGEHGQQLGVRERDGRLAVAPRLARFGRTRRAEMEGRQGVLSTEYRVASCVRGGTEYRVASCEWNQEQPSRSTHARRQFRHGVSISLWLPQPTQCGVES